MTQYIMNDKELKEAQQRANSLAQQIESCDITNVTQEVSTAKKAFENLNVDELQTSTAMVTWTRMIYRL